jgi:hypothetical protein
MSVYVDDMEAPFGRMKMCHMTADTHAELLAMADRIGVARRWIQYPGQWKEHFDICLSKRASAIRFGAIQLSMQDLVMKQARARDAAKAIAVEAN